MGVCQYSMQLGPYLDGELGASQRTLLEAHLHGCGDCDTELSELQGLSRAFAAVGPFLQPEAMARFHERISELEADQEQAERTARRILRITRALTGMAACLLIAGSLWLERTRPKGTIDAPNTAVAEAAPSLPAVSLAQAPWDAAIQPTEPAPIEPKSPADDTADWMSSQLSQSGSVGDNGQ
jgi:anti-sigma factor RsiW